MASTTFLIEGAINLEVKVTEVGGNLKFDVKVLETGGQIGDLRGLFFNLDDDCTGLSVTGDDVTGSGQDTRNLGNGVNLNGSGAGNFDIGVKLGTPGIGKDDIQETSFTVSCDEGLTLDALAGQLFGVRLTSVGEPGGPRDGSLKIIDTPREDTEPCDPICEDVTVDFEEFRAGQTVSTISTLDGALTIKVRASENGEANTDNDAMIFNADNDPPASGGDNDLLAGDGKVLIISEDDDASDPDDAEQGGNFRFVFSDAVDLSSIVVIDNEEGARITAFDADGRIGSIIVPTTADGVLQTVDLSAFDDVTRLKVSFDGSGALDDLEFQYCPPDPSCDCIL